MLELFGSMVAARVMKGRDRSEREILRPRRSLINCKRELADGLHTEKEQEITSESKKSERIRYSAIRP